MSDFYRELGDLFRRAAAREALTLDELGAVAGWTGEAPRRTFVRRARELLI